MSAGFIENRLLNTQVAVVIPSYKVSSHIIDVVSSAPNLMIWRIYVIDDACSEGAGEFIEVSIGGKRGRVLCHDQN